MQYNQITYARQHNLGNYESEKIELVVTVEEHENVDTVLRNVKIKVAQGLGVQPKVEQIDEVVEGGDVITADGKQKDPATGEETKKKRTKKAKKKTTSKRAKADGGAKAGKEVDEEDRKDSDEGPEKVGGEESTGEVVSLGEVKEALVAVWKAKGRAVADDILQSFNVKKSNELMEEDYAKVISECNKVLS